MNNKIESNSEAYRRFMERPRKPGEPLRYYPEPWTQEGQVLAVKELENWRNRRGDGRERHGDRICHRGRDDHAIAFVVLSVVKFD